MLGSRQPAWGSRLGQVEDIGQGRAIVSCRLPRVAPAVAPKRSGVLDRHAQYPPPASQPSAAGGGSHRGGNAARAMVNQEAHKFAALPTPATTELGGEDQQALRASWEELRVRPLFSLARRGDGDRVSVRRSGDGRAASGEGGDEGGIAAERLTKGRGAVDDEVEPSSVGAGDTG